MAELFSNGGYLALRENGVIAFNWIDPGNLVPLPGEFYWRRDNNKLTVVLNDVTYEFVLAADSDRIVTLDTTRSFEMTMQKIRLGAQ